MWPLFLFNSSSGVILQTRRTLNRLAFCGLAVAAASLTLAVSGCGSMMQPSNMVAFTTQLRGANEVPPNASNGSGSVDAAFNKETMLLRWKVNYTGLTGIATAGHFHGPAAVGANSGVALGWANPMTTGMEGSATLTAAQAADLMAGKWYANIHTAANPGGELRGQMTVRN
jgi:CHRD domain